MSEKTQNNVAATTGENISQQASRFEGKTPKKIELDKAKLKRKYAALRSIIASQVERAGGYVLQKGVIKYTNKVRSEHGVVDRIYKLQDLITKKYFKASGEKLYKQLQDEKILDKPDGLEKARKRIQEFFAKNRKAYLGLITTLFASLALDKSGRTPQIDLETFTKNFENLFNTVGMIGSFDDLIEISNLAEGFAKGKRKNELFDIHVKLRENQPLSAPNLAFLGQKFLDANYDNFARDIIGRYERMVLPMIAMSLSEGDRFRVMAQLIQKAERSGAIVRSLKDWYIAGLLSKSQIYRLLDVALAKMNNKNSLQKFANELKNGLLEKDKYAAKKFVERQMRNQKFSLSGRNFALQKLNFFNLIGYQIVWSGALVGIMTGLFSGVIRSIQSKDPNEFLAVITHKVFLGSVAVLGATTEWATQHKRPGKSHAWSNVSKGAVSSWLESLGQGGKKTKETNRKKAEKSLFWDMSNHPQVSRFFLSNYQAINQYLTAKTEGGTKLRNPQKILNRSQLEKITGKKMLNEFDGIPAGEIGVLIYRYWYMVKFDLKMAGKEAIKSRYQEELINQGVIARENRGRRYESYQSSLETAEKKHRRKVIREAFEKARKAVRAEKANNPNS